MPLPVPSPIPDESPDSVAGLIMYAFACLLVVSALLVLLATVLADDTDEDAE